MTQKTLIILKPDAIQRGLIGQIITRLENKGLKIIAMKLTQIDRKKAEKHYAEHIGKDFFENLVEYITSTPVILIICQGPSAISVTRKLVGPTDGQKAEPGTIRGDFGISIRYNLIHASDSPESAEREINIFFDENEIFEYKKEILKWSWQE